jgi:hypothetical protein
MEGRRNARGLGDLPETKPNTASRSFRQARQSRGKGSRDSIAVGDLTIAFEEAFSRKTPRFLACVPIWKTFRGLATTSIVYSVNRSQYMSILVLSHGRRAPSYYPYALIVLARFPTLNHVRESEREARTLTSFKVLSPANSSLTAAEDV